MILLTISSSLGFTSKFQVFILYCERGSMDFNFIFVQQHLCVCCRILKSLVFIYFDVISGVRNYNSLNKLIWRFKTSSAD